MRVTYDHHGPRTVSLPFTHVTARAIIVRRSDGFLLGMLHRKRGSYAPPGGHMDDGESPDQTVLRELAEEQIELLNADPRWRDWFAVDVYPPTGALNLWYLFLVDDARIGGTPEAEDIRWLDPAEEAWYPTVREKILLAVQHFTPRGAELHG